jgi:hypothetical protein
VGEEESDFLISFLDANPFADEPAAREYAIAVPLDVAAGSYFSQEGVGRVFDGRQLVGSSARTGLPAA